jgi:hypothetical protein
VGENTNHDGNSGDDEAIRHFIRGAFIGGGLALLVCGMMSFPLIKDHGVVGVGMAVGGGVGPCIALSLLVSRRAMTAGMLVGAACVGLVVGVCVAVNGAGG